jgi:hypothetical protein
MSIAWEKEVETLEFSPNPIINNKIKLAVSGLQKGVQRLVLELPTEHDKELVADFILASMKQENLTIAAKRTYVIALVYLSRHFDNKKSFEDITNTELANYTNSFQKEWEQDPDRSWISTQRTLGWPLLKFFKWLAYPKLTPQERSRLPRSKYPRASGICTANKERIKDSS